MSSTMLPLLLMALVDTCGGQEAIEFSAASVKVLDASHPYKGPTGGPGTTEPGRYFARVWLADLIQAAYGVSDDQVRGGPGWLRWGADGASLYEIDATLPPATTKQQFQGMLQKLLVDRFHLAVHRDSANFPAFELAVAKGGPRLKAVRLSIAESRDRSTAPPSRIPVDGDGFPVLPEGPHTGQILSKGNLKFKFQQRSMDYFSGILGSMIYQAEGPSFGPSAPKVVDKTGLTGVYDFTLEYKCGGCVGAKPMGGTADEPANSMLEPEGPSIFVALEKQLGLKATKGPDISVPVVFVDHIDKNPVGN